MFLQPVEQEFHEDERDQAGRQRREETLEERCEQPSDREPHEEVLEDVIDSPENPHDKKSGQELIDDHSDDPKSRKHPQEIEPEPWIVAPKLTNTRDEGDAHHTHSHRYGGNGADSCKEPQHDNRAPEADGLILRRHDPTPSDHTFKKQ